MADLGGGFAIDGESFMELAAEAFDAVALALHEDEAAGEARLLVEDGDIVGRGLG